MNCSTQDMLEAASVQRRRITLSYKTTNGQKQTINDAVVLDVYTEAGREMVTIRCSDVISHIESQRITAFQANDSLRPEILYPKQVG